MCTFDVTDDKEGIDNGGSLDEKGDSEDVPQLEDVDSDEEFWENME